MDTQVQKPCRTPNRQNHFVVKNTKGPEQRKNVKSYKREVPNYVHRQTYENYI
jgi:hypothetical protein